MLGSNLGDRSENFDWCRNLMESAGIKLLKSSGVYQTKAWGLTDQPDFYNQAIEIASPFEPEALLNLFKDIEIQMGRTDTGPNGPRIIDIDILLFGDMIISSDNLIVPHPRMHMRRFNLVPAAEIASHVIHPVLKLSINDLLSVCTDPSEAEIIIEA